ncbi:MAG: STAS domain-containing protein [Pseudonocardiaceae bacterium]
MLRDLELRVHTPIPEVVIVRVSGTVNRLTAAALAQRVGRQLARAPHVVVDLGEVTVADPRDLAVLFRLPRRARANGTQIYIARAEREEVRRALRVTGLDQMFTLVPTAEAVVAGLPRPVASRTESSQPQ